jgi:glycosyltransferase involved in cell wall biosynthesis
MSEARDGTKLSAYTLTRNSERLLRRVLEPMTRVADEIVVVDSGSTDGTLDIARSLGCRVEHVPFENFRLQREKAQALCAHDRVLFLDSDEVMSEALVNAVRALKVAGFTQDVYRMRRDWIVLGRPVHAFYPNTCPDYPIRIIDRRVVHFGRSNDVHESPAGYMSEGAIEAPLTHYSYGSRQEIEAKLDFYTSLAARDLLRLRGRPSPMPLAVGRALAAFGKWYFLKGSWRDGAAGLAAGRYAYRYTWLKHRKAAALRLATTSGGMMKREAA